MKNERVVSAILSKNHTLSHLSKLEISYAVDSQTVHYAFFMFCRFMFRHYPQAPLSPLRNVYFGHCAKL